MDQPKPISEQVHRRMSAQRTQGTEPELALRRLLHAAGFRYRVGYPVPCAPRRTIDIAFPKKKVAVFIDGCFWHGCPTHAVPPKNNAQWWSSKLEGNKSRDAETTSLLEDSGWRVVRLWEHTSADSMLAAVKKLWQHDSDAEDEGTMKC